MDDFGRGYGAGGLVLGHGGREESIKRHDEHAAADRDAEQAEQQRADRRVAEEAADVIEGARRFGAPVAAYPIAGDDEGRSEERPVGKAGDSTCRTGG